MIYWLVKDISTVSSSAVEKICEVCSRAGHRTKHGRYIIGYSENFLLTRTQWLYAPAKYRWKNVKLQNVHIQRISFQIIWDHNSCRCALWRPSKVSPYIDKVLLFLHFLVLWDCRFNTFILALNPGLDSMRDITSGMISHEKTQSNRFWCEAVFPKVLLSDY